MRLEKGEYMARRMRGESVLCKGLISYPFEQKGEGKRKGSSPELG